MERNVESAGLNSAVIVVDVQNDFCPGGSLAVPEGNQVVEKINRITNLARDCMMPVIFSRDWHPQKTTHFAQLGGKWPVHCVQNTLGANFHPQLVVKSYGDEIVSKGMGSHEDAYSAFAGHSEGWSLEAILHEYETERVYILGLATDYCVKFTSLDAVRLGFETILVEDACRAVNPDGGKSAVEEMKKAGITVASSKEVLEDFKKIRSWLEHEHFQRPFLPNY